MSIALVKNIDVQTADGGSRNTSVWTVPAGGVAKGNLVVLRWGTNGKTVTITSVSDTQGNTYKLGRRLSPNDTNATMEIWYSVLGTALVSGNTITALWSAFAGPAGVWVADEFSGSALQPLDGASSTEGSSDSPVSGNITTGVSNELLIGAVAIAGPSGDSFTQDTNFTGLTGGASGTGGAAASHCIGKGGYRLVETTETQDYSPTITIRAWECAIVSIKPYNPITAGGAGGLFRNPVL